MRSLVVGIAIEIQFHQIGLVTDKRSPTTVTISVPHLKQTLSPQANGSIGVEPREPIKCPSQRPGQVDHQRATIISFLARIRDFAARRPSSVGISSNQLSHCLIRRCIFRISALFGVVIKRRPPCFDYALIRGAHDPGKLSCFGVFTPCIDSLIDAIVATHVKTSADSRRRGR